MPRTSSRDGLRVLWLVPLFVVVPLLELFRGTSLTSITNGDFWWHLQTGLSILKTGGLPHNGWFSQSAAMPWIAASWLYDVLVAIGYRLLDLRFLPLLAMLCKLGLAMVSFLLAGGLRGRFWTAFLLSAIVQYLLWGMQPVPVYCSVLAFGVELTLLFQCRRHGERRPLLFLPLLFLFWANLDPHFVYGIVALLLFALVSTVEHAGVSWIRRENAAPAIGFVWAVTAISLFATFATPYGWNVYASFWAQAAGAVNQRMPDFQSLRFRTPQDYVVLLLAMLAFLALGLRRSRDLFEIGLLALCIMASLHAQRDVWLTALAAVAVVANAAAAEEKKVVREPSSQSTYAPLVFAAGLGLVILFAAFAIRIPRREAVLARIGESYPVGAANYIREHRLPAPLFNTYPWGGFLAWYLPEYPVAIDGRTDLYSPEFDVQYAKVMNFEAHYSTFPPLNDAGTILLEKNSTMAKALATVPAFKTAYSDDVAVVLVRQQVRP